MLKNNQLFTSPYGMCKVAYVEISSEFYVCNAHLLATPVVKGHRDHLFALYSPLSKRHMQRGLLVAHTVTNLWKLCGNGLSAFVQVVFNSAGYTRGTSLPVVQFMFLYPHVVDTEDEYLSLQ